MTFVNNMVNCISFTNSNNITGCIQNRGKKFPWQHISITIVFLSKKNLYGGGKQKTKTSSYFVS